jgi:hypothetical protein
VPSKSRLNFVLDAAIFAAFLVTAFTGLLLWLALPNNGPGSGWSALLGLTRHTWVDIHSLAGLVVMIGVIWHLVMHWDWILCVARRFLGRATRQSRINFSLATIMFALFFLTSLSGLIGWHPLAGGYRGGRNPFPGATPLALTRLDWNDLHIWVGVAMVALILVHLALHWKWIVCVARRCAQDVVGGLSCPVPDGERLTDS